MLIPYLHLPSILIFAGNIDQVTIARVYNWDVHQRRLRQAATATATPVS